MSVGIIGAGAWGRKLIEQFSLLSSVDSFNTAGGVVNVEFMTTNYPHIPLKTTEDILKSDNIETVVIATPISTHYELCLKALENNKNVFIEKPLATSLKEAKELNELAQKKNLVLFVGHKFLYHPMIEKIKELDKIHNFSGNFLWEKWGTFKENIFWNLIVHDLMLAIEMFGRPKSIEVKKILNSDMASIYLYYKNRDMMIITHNRLSKHKFKDIMLLSQTNQGKNYRWFEDQLIYTPKKHVKYDFTGTNLIELECKKFLEHIEKKELVDNSNVLECIRLLENIV